MQKSSTKDFYLQRWYQLRKGPAFSREVHFAALSTSISIATTLITYYHLPNEWAEKKSAQKLIELTSDHIPSIEKLQFIEGINNNFWQLFFAIHFRLLTLHFFIGIAGSVFLDEQIEAIYEQMLWKMTLANYLFALSCIAFAAYTPLINLHPPHSWYIDQISNFFPKLLFSWFCLSGLSYWSGNMTSKIIYKTLSKLLKSRQNCDGKNSKDTSPN